MEPPSRGMYLIISKKQVVRKGKKYACKAMFPIKQRSLKQVLNRSLGRLGWRLSSS